MAPNLAGSIYVRSSIKLHHLVPFGQQTWPPRLILFSDWLMLKKIFSSETAWPNGAKLGRKHLCKVQTWHRWSLGAGCVPFKIVSDSPTLHSRWLLFFKVMIISLWNLLQYHSIVRWAIQAQWAELLVIYDDVFFVLDQYAKLDFNSASSLKQQSAGKYVFPLWHIILIPKQHDFALTL